MCTHPVLIVWNSVKWMKWRTWHEAIGGCPKSRGFHALLPVVTKKSAIEWGYPPVLMILQIGSKKFAKVPLSTWKNTSLIDNRSGCQNGVYYLTNGCFSLFCFVGNMIDFRHGRPGESHHHFAGASILFQRVIWLQFGGSAKKTAATQSLTPIFCATAFNALL